MKCKHCATELRIGAPKHVCDPSRTKVALAPTPFVGLAAARGSLFGLGANGVIYEFNNASDMRDGEWEVDGRNQAGANFWVPLPELDSPDRQDHLTELVDAYDDSSTLADMILDDGTIDHKAVAAGSRLARAVEEVVRKLKEK